MCQPEGRPKNVYLNSPLVLIIQLFLQIAFWTTFLQAVVLSKYFSDFCKIMWKFFYKWCFLQRAVLEIFLHNFPNCHPGQLLCKLPFHTIVCKLFFWIALKLFVTTFFWGLVVSDQYFVKCLSRQTFVKCNFCQVSVCKISSLIMDHFFANGLAQKVLSVQLRSKSRQKVLNVRIYVLVD